MEKKQTNRMTLDEAVKMLQDEYERAKRLEFVHNPLAWAVYQVWKIADRNGVKSNEQ